LEIAVSHFKAGDSDSALEFIRKAVELCEQNPVHALSRSSDRESSLQQIIQGMLRNAIAKRPSADQWKALLGRIQALNVTSIH
jgi:hypothetical protein